MGFQDDIDLALEMGTVHLNIIGQIYHYTVEEGVDVTPAWMVCVVWQLGRSLGYRPTGP